MERLSTYYLSALFLLNIFSCANRDGDITRKNKITQKEKLVDQYLKNGAWRYNMFSLEWQKCIDSALAIDNGISYLYQQKSMPYFKSGDYYNGLVNLDRAVLLSPEKYLAYRGFIKIMFLRDYEGSIADFLKAEEISPGAYEMDHDYNFYLGLANLMLKRFDSSLEYFDKSLEQEKAIGGNSIHHLNLFYFAILKIESNELSAALEYINLCLDSYNSYPDALYYKSIIYFKMKQYENALKASRESLIYFEKDFGNNEDNEIYVSYPYQIKKSEIIFLINKIENEIL